MVIYKRISRAFQEVIELLTLINVTEWDSLLLLCELYLLTDIPLFAPVHAISQTISVLHAYYDVLIFN